MSKFFRDVIVKLEIRSWIAYDPEAIHSYGTLKWDTHGDRHRMEECELFHKLSYGEARRMSIGHNRLWRRGEKSSSFEKKRDLITAAKEKWRECCPDHQVLAIGDYVEAEPCEVIDAPNIAPEVVEQLNDIWREHESVANNQPDNAVTHAVLDEISDRWEALLIQNLDDVRAALPVEEG